jgi:hypothetical protein
MLVYAGDLIFWVQGVEIPTMKSRIIRAKQWSTWTGHLGCGGLSAQVCGNDERLVRGSIEICQASNDVQDRSYSLPEMAILRLLLRGVCADTFASTRSGDLPDLLSLKS